MVLKDELLKSLNADVPEIPSISMLLSYRNSNLLFFLSWLECGL